MNKTVFGTFPNHADAERCISELQSDVHVSIDDLSYLYRDATGEIKEDTSRTDEIVEGGATGATVGATIGAIAGLATIAGVIPVIGPIFAAGPLIAALGIGAGAVATTAAGAVTGAVAGGLVGALVEWGVPSDIASTYEDRLNAGEILLAVSTNDAPAVENKFVECNANSVTTHTPVA